MVHSSKLTWKWRGSLQKTTILYVGPSVSFHVNLGEGVDFDSSETACPELFSPFSKPQYVSTTGDFHPDSSSVDQDLHIPPVPKPCEPYSQHYG